MPLKGTSEETAQINWKLAVIRAASKVHVPARSRRTVIVAGMHRSGTSMTANVIKHLGFNMGQRLLGKTEHNPLGHYEDMAFMELNNAILTEAGGSWDSPPNPDALAAVMALHQEQFNRLIKGRERFGNWGVKDPRISLMLEYYTPQMPNCRIIVCQRAPEEVARSLAKRDGSDYQRNLGLAYLYQSAIDKFLAKNPRVKAIRLDYNKMRSQPQRGLAKIVSFLGQPVTMEQLRGAHKVILNDEQLAEAKQRFMSPIQAKLRVGAQHYTELPSNFTSPGPLGRTPSTTEALAAFKQ